MGKKDTNKTEAPVEAPKQSEAASVGKEIAAAISEASGKGKNFTMEPDAGVQNRFSVVKAKGTGEVMIRENENGKVSKVQLKSIEEKEADLKATEVEEL